jgi:two-component system sensor histidine kinase VicK
MVTNIVANAIKYSPAGGPVTVSTLHRATEVELTVADEGMGIPEQDRERIFVSYGRINRPEQMSIEGTGLGLPIARNIVELHRGRIWVEENIPVGSVFHVVLPYADPSPATPKEGSSG